MSRRPGELTSPEVAALVGLSPSQVQRTPRSELPYRETPGGARRGGRRFYAEGDVEAFLARRAGADTRVAELERRVVALEGRVAELEGRRVVGDGPS